MIKGIMKLHRMTGLYAEGPKKKKKNNFKIQNSQYIS